MVIRRKPERIFSKCKTDGYIEISVQSLLKLRKICEMRIDGKIFFNNRNMVKGKPCILPKIEINQTKAIKIRKVLKNWNGKRNYTNSSYPDRQIVSTSISKMLVILITIIAITVRIFKKMEKCHDTFEVHTRGRLQWYPRIYRTSWITPLFLFPRGCGVTKVYSTDIFKKNRIILIVL